jgi:myosin-5
MSTTNSVYIKGTRVWIPDTAAGWVAGTITSVALPADNDPTSQVTITVTVEDANGAGATKDYKCTLATLQAASDTSGNIIAPSSSSGQNSLPPLRNPPLLESSEDLASLSNLNEPSGRCSRLIVCFGLKC